MVNEIHPSDHRIDRANVFATIQTERHQSHQTRVALFKRLRERLGRPVVTFFTSFRYPVSIDDDDADILEGILRKIDLSNGLALMISSPGGDGLAAERIINICRNYSGTDEFWTIVPGKAKSAATMICFGASRILMGPSSELGPVDPQLIFSSGDGGREQFSAHHLVNSYDDLFSRAVKEKGRLEPFLQQLSHYDERQIREFRAVIELAEDISIRTLKSGMMSSLSEAKIRKKIERFLTPKQTKSHGRPIFRDEATECGLKIDHSDVRDEVWGDVYELYIRTNDYVSTRHMKCIESVEDSFSVNAPPHQG